VLGMMRKEKGKVIGQRGVTTLCRVSCAGLCAAAVPVLRHYRTQGPTRAAAGCASDTTLALAAQELCAPRLYTCLAFHDHPHTKESSNNTVVRTSNM